MGREKDGKGATRPLSPVDGVLSALLVLVPAPAPRLYAGPARVWVGGGTGKLTLSVSQKCFL